MSIFAHMRLRTTSSASAPLSKGPCQTMVSGTGRFQLAPGSPGAGAAQVIPNYSDGYTGKAPDVGAHQRGAPPVRYGIDAGQP